MNSAIAFSTLHSVNFSFNLVMSKGNYGPIRERVRYPVVPPRVNLRSRNKRGNQVEELFIGAVFGYLFEPSGDDLIFWNQRMKK